MFASISVAKRAHEADRSQRLTELDAYERPQQTISPEEQPSRARGQALINFEDVSTLIVLMIGAALLVRVLQRRRGRRVDVPALIVVAVAIAALTLFGNSALPIVFAAWVVLILFPALVLRRVSRHLNAQEYGKAGRLLDLLIRIRLARGLEQQREIFRGAELAKAGKPEQAIEHLKRLETLDHPSALSARLQRLRLEQKWDEILALLETQLNERQGREDPVALTLFLRSLGETGNTERLIREFAHYRQTITNFRVNRETRGAAYLFLFAFCGRPQAVQRLLQTVLMDYPALSKDFWLATAKLTGGHRDGVVDLSSLLATADPLNRTAIEDRIAQAEDSHGVELSAELAAIVDGADADQLREDRSTLLASYLRHHAWVTNAILTLNLLVFSAEIVVSALTNIETLKQLAPLELIAAVFGRGSTDIQTLERLGALDTAAVRAGEIWRLFTFVFLHYGLFHIASNMLALWAIGPFVEKRLGRLSFFSLYMLAGTGSGVVWFLLQSDRILVGASGAIFSLVGAAGALLLKTWLAEKSRLARTNFILIVVVVAFQCLFDVTHRAVSGEAHLSGLAIGFVFGLLNRSRHAGVPASNRR